MFVDNSMKENQALDSDSQSGAKKAAASDSRIRPKVLSPQVDKPVPSPEGDSICFWDPYESEHSFKTPVPKNRRKKSSGEQHGHLFISNQTEEPKDSDELHLELDPEGINKFAYPDSSQKTRC